MFLLHSRCLSLETTLLARIQDLEQTVADVRERADADRVVWMQRERDLLDRLIVAVNPAAARALGEMYAREARSDKPAAPPPSVDRARMERAPLPRGSANVPINRDRVGPMLTPSEERFRPAAAAAEPADETAG